MLFFSCVWLWLSVFAFVLIIEHGEIGAVAAVGNPVVGEGCEDGTARLAGVGAATKTAVMADGEDVAEVVGHLLATHVVGAEAADAGGVDDGARRQVVHLGEGGGVATLVVGHCCR